MQAATVARGLFARFWLDTSKSFVPRAGDARAVCRAIMASYGQAQHADPIKRSVPQTGPVKPVMERGSRGSACVH
jgi:hypothetical protein